MITHFSRGRIFFCEGGATSSPSFTFYPLLESAGSTALHRYRTGALFGADASVSNHTAFRLPREKHKALVSQKQKINNTEKEGFFLFTNYIDIIKTERRVTGGGKLERFMFSPANKLKKTKNIHLMLFNRYQTQFDLVTGCVACVSVCRVSRVTLKKTANRSDDAKGENELQTCFPHYLAVRTLLSEVRCKLRTWKQRSS